LDFLCVYLASRWIEGEVLWPYMEEVAVALKGHGECNLGSLYIKWFRSIKNHPHRIGTDVYINLFIFGVGFVLLKNGYLQFVPRGQVVQQFLLRNSLKCGGIELVDISLKLLLLVLKK